MKSTEFAGHNVVLAKDQPQYLPLPVLITESGEVVSCWKLSVRERIRILFTGCMWLRQLTFGQPLQPQRPQVESPLPELVRL